MIDVKDNERQELIAMKRDFIRKISLLQLSKQLLVSLENVGILNQRDACYYSLDLSGHDLVLRYIFRISKHDWTKLNKHHFQFKENVLAKCTKSRNQQLDVMSLGQRNAAIDLTLKFKNPTHNFSLLGFEEGEKKRFVVAYLNGASFMSEDVY